MTCCEVLTVDPKDLHLSTNVPFCFSPARHSLYNEAARSPTPYLDHSPSPPSDSIEDELLSNDEPLSFSLDELLVYRPNTPVPLPQTDGEDLKITAADQLLGVIEDPEKIANDWQAFENNRNPNSSLVVESTPPLEIEIDTNEVERPPTPVSEVVLESTPPLDVVVSNDEDERSPIPISEVVVESTPPLEIEIDTNEGERPPTPVSEVVVEKVPSVNPAQSTSDRMTTSSLNEKINTPSPPSNQIHHASAPIHHPKDDDPLIPDIAEGQSRKHPIVILDNDNPPVKRCRFTKLGNANGGGAPIDELLDDGSSDLTRKGRNPPAALPKTSSAMISPRELEEEEERQNAIDALNRTAANTVTVKNEREKKWIKIYLDEVLVNLEIVKKYLETSFRDLIKQPHEERHKELIEKLLIDLVKLRVRMKTIKTCTNHLQLSPSVN